MIKNHEKIFPLLMDNHCDEIIFTLTLFGLIDLQLLLGAAELGVKGLTLYAHVGGYK